MMREIKFRGKRPHNNKWITGCLVEKGIHAHILGNGHWEVECATEVLRDTLGQFTGLIDNSEEKEEIYGGDILRAMNGDNFIVEYLTDWGAYKIYRPDGSNTRCLNDLRVDIIELFELRIVGNITDNPELLDVKNE